MRQLVFYHSVGFCKNLCGHSVEKDGSCLSDEKQTIQTSLFALLKDLLKSPTPEELHSVLAYILTAGEEKQVILECFIVVLMCLDSLMLQYLTFSEFTPKFPSFEHSSIKLIFDLFLLLLMPLSAPVHISPMLSGGEGLGCSVRAPQEQPSS